MNVRDSIIEVLANRRYEDAHRRSFVDLLHDTPLSGLMDRISQNIHANFELYMLLMENGEDYPDLWEVISKTIDESVDRGSDE